MAKPKEISEAEDSLLEESPGSHKKHKKHKKHKHKKKQDDEDEDSFIEVESVDEAVKPTIKLKIKFGGQGFSPKSKDGASADTTPGTSAPGSPHAKKKKKNADSDTSDEEKQWLDALEKGTLDDNGEVKKDKDISLLTARQRSLLHGLKEEALLELPTGYKSTELTEEQLQRRQQRAKKRREQAQEKREKDKKQTLDRLLKKQDAKSKNSKTRASRRPLFSGLRYVNSQSGIRISVPQGHQLPFSQKQQKQPPKAQQCGVKDCKKLKKYSCSKTNIPLCSLLCYKKNMALQKLGAAIT